MYWHLYGAWRTVKVQLSLFKTQQEELDNARTLFEGGEGTLADVYGFESGLANQVVRLIEADYRLRDVMRNLKAIIQDPDMSLSSAQVIEPASPPSLILYEFKLPDLLTEALQNRMEILEDELQIARSELQIDVAENELLPTLNARIGVTFQGESDDSYTQANSSLFRGDYDTGWNVGLQASYPLGNQIARASYQRARLQRLKFIATKAQREITISKEVYAAVDALASAWSKLIASGIEVDAAERSFKAENELFDLGDRTSTDVSVAIFRLGHARENRIHAEVEYEISLARLAHATGSFLGYAGVQWSSETVDTIIPTDNQKQIMPPPGVNESELIEGQENQAIKRLRESMDEPVRPPLPPDGFEIGEDRKDPPSPDAPDTPRSPPNAPALDGPLSPDTPAPDVPTTPDTPTAPDPNVPTSPVDPQSGTGSP
jgi:outer membrane protein TolC